MNDYNPQLADRIQLRKKHPCGSETWQVVRVGVDIGLECEGCGRKILLARHIFRKRVKKLLSEVSVERRNQGNGSLMVQIQGR